MDVTKYFTLTEMTSILDNYFIAREATDEMFVINLVGHKGLGKSEFIKNYCKENNIGYHYENLPAITEETRLIGYPKQAYTVSKKVQSKKEDGTYVEKNITKDIRVEEIQEYKKDGWNQLSKDSKLSYSKPEFVEKLEKTRKSALFLDELNRSLPHISAGVMQLLNTGAHADWELPKGCLIIAANNPNDGNYKVNSFDIASNDRLFTYNIKFDLESWMVWAGKNKINEQCINFLAKTEEIRNSFNQADGLSPRTWSKFFKSINHFQLSKDDSNWGNIYNMGVGSIGEDNLMLFRNFIDNDLNTVPSLNWVFNPLTEIRDAVKVLKEATTDRFDIKGLVGLRLKTYLRSIEKSDLNVKFTEKIIGLISHDVFPADIITMLAYDISSNSNTHPHKDKLLNILITNKKSADIILDAKIKFK